MVGTPRRGDPSTGDHAEAVKEGVVPSRPVSTFGPHALSEIVEGDAVEEGPSTNDLVVAQPRITLPSRKAS
jgi:hypothetical protein